LNLSADIFAVLIYVLSIVVIYHSYKSRGWFKTLFLLFGFFVVGGGIENINIAFRGYYYPGSPLTIYLLNCPLWVILRWYLIAYAASIIAHTIIGNGRGSLHIIGYGIDLENGIDNIFIKHSILRALLTAYLSMLIGLIMDPTAAAQGWWVWKIDNIYIHGVPFGNYLGWVFVVFWTMLLHDFLLIWAWKRNQRELITSFYWILLSTIALLLAGLMLMGSTFWFGLEGIRTDDRTYLWNLVINVRWEGIIMSILFCLLSFGLILICSFFPNKLPEVRPETKIWHIIPPITLLIYWIVMMIATFLTSILLVAAGIINGVPLFLICFYIIKNPKLKEQ